MKILINRNRCTKIYKIKETNRDIQTAVTKVMKKVRQQDIMLQEEVDVCITEMI